MYRRTWSTLSSFGKVGNEIFFCYGKEVKKRNLVRNFLFNSHSNRVFSLFSFYYTSVASASRFFRFSIRPVSTLCLLAFPFYSPIISPWIFTGDLGP